MCIPSWDTFYQTIQRPDWLGILKTGHYGSITGCNLATPITMHQYMSKCQKLGSSTNYRLSKMDCLEYCYCLITTIIISVLVVINIIYHHYYHHYYDYYYHHHCYHQNRYLHLEYLYLKYYLEYNSRNKLVFIQTFRKLFTNLTQKVIPTPKNWDKK